MLTPDHPNAKWLADHYLGGTDIENDETLDEDARERAMVDILQRVFARFSPDFTIHTGGIQLSATGDLAFTLAYGNRRKALTAGTFRPVLIDQILADDEHGIVHGTFRSERDGQVFEFVGMGIWRFDAEGQAVEHWEIPPGQAWDQFFVAGDPDFGDGSATQFWTKK